MIQILKGMKDRFSDDVKKYDYITTCANVNAMQDFNACGNMHYTWEKICR